MLPLRFVRPRDCASVVEVSVGDGEPSRGFVVFRVFSIPGGVTPGQEILGVRAVNRGVTTPGSEFAVVIDDDG